MIRTAIAATIAAAAAVVGLASPASATVNSSGAVGNPANYAPYWRLQTAGTCVEYSALMAMSALHGGWVASTAGIDAEAVKLGILNADLDGSTFDAANDALYAHYGFKATAPHSTSKATVMADLAAGDAVQVTVYAGDIWDGTVYDGSIYNDPSSTPSPDHAVIVEAINKTTGRVTLGDTGVPWGNGETVSWSQFSAAWGVGGYEAIVVSP